MADLIGHEFEAFEGYGDQHSTFVFIGVFLHILYAVGQSKQLSAVDLNRVPSHSERYTWIYEICEASKHFASRRI